MGKGECVRVLVSEDLLEKLTKGEVKYVKEGRIRLGRWRLGRKIGVLIGCESETKS